MLEPWVPFDATPEEVAELHVVRDGIPATLRPAILAWIIDQLPVIPYSSKGLVTTEMIHTLQTALRIDFGLAPKESMSRQALVKFIESQGEQTILRVVDFMASWYRRQGWIDTPIEIAPLEFHLDAGSSAFEVYPTEDGPYRIRRRITEGVEEAVQAAIDLQPVAGRHLANAWRSATALEPNESFAMTEAIRAVEAASGPVVIPKDRKPTLGKVVKVLQDQPGWTLVLTASDGYPNHLEVLIGMMETLAKAQPDRHSGNKPTPLEAQAHAQLAATLVHWFASGAIIRETA